MYLIGIDKNGRHGCGNSYTMHIGPMHSALAFKAAKQFKSSYGHSEVYIINRYTQEMCEMSKEKFIAYVKRNGVKV